MNISTTESIYNALNKSRLGIITFRSEITNSNSLLWNEIDAFCHTVQQLYKLEQVNKIDTIIATREAYKKCGKDPNRYRPSADSLIRRIVKGNSLYRINNVVDVLNFISIQTGFSIGGYDTEKIEGNIVFDIATKTDNYSGIGRGELNIEGLPALRDNISVFGTPTSDSERTMITNNSTNCMFVFFDFGVSEKLSHSLEITRVLLNKYANAKDLALEIITIQNTF